MLASVPFVAVSAVVFGKRVKALRKSFQDELAKGSSTGEEVISNIRTVRAFSQEDRLHNKYSEDINSSYGIGKKIAFISGLFMGGVTMLSQTAIVLVVYVGAKQVLSGAITTGSLTSFLLYTITVAFSFAFLSSLFGDFMSAVGASERIFELMDKQPSIPHTGGETPHSVRGEIALEEVRFTYPARPEKEVLQGVSLSIPPGNIVALVGPSGGGKSTIVSLIERYYNPTSGRLTLDGIDIKQLHPKWFRSQIGFVSQEPVLFGCSIKENIAFGSTSATDEMIQEAAIKANAHQFIETFSEKYDTLVGERGVRLSGGQRQRLAIARALLLNPQILLLDEATSALDAESEFLVQQAIERLMQNRTVLVIAHRLSTVRNANLVAVVSDGKIVETGTHAQLMESKDGIYRKLVKRQLQAD
jgi:ABC-type multidrug transport system fused ATPase/permease subunit